VHSQIRRLGAAWAATLLFTSLLCVAAAQAPALPDKAPNPAKRQILAIAGGGLEKGDGPPPLMRYFLKLTDKEKPRVCFMPAASGDAVGEITRWNQVMKEMPCEPRVQKVYIASPKAKSFDEELLKADAIYVGGGNAVNMLAMWQAHGIDKILRQAYERGIVLGGEGAGAICWFEQGLTDSRPGKLTPLDCLCLVKGSHCPGFDTDKSRKPTYHDWVKKGEIKDGYAADHGVGLHFVDEKLVKVVSANEAGRAYRVRREGDKTVEAVLKAEVLAK
jgi:dipeptidase E